jgi:hypothetical protein
MAETKINEDLPQTSRRKKYLLIGLVIALLLIAPLVIKGLHNSQKGKEELEEAVAETDRLDPGWELDDLEAHRRVIPDRRNGGLQVEAAHNNLAKNWQSAPIFEKLEYLDLEPPVLLDEAQTKALRAELTKQARALLDARRLQDFPRGRFPIHWTEDGLHTLVPHLEQVRSVANLLGYDVLLRARDGDGDGALASARAALNAGRSVGDEPLLISLLVRIACQAVAVRRLEQALAQGLPSDEALAGVQKALEEEARQPLLLIGLRGERASLHRFMTSLEGGKVNLGDMFGHHGVRNLKEQIDDFLAGNTAESSHAWMLRFLSRAVEIAKRPLGKQRHLFQELEADLQEAPPLARMLVPATVKVREAHLRILAQLRCAAVALAVERYRRRHDRWPAGLKALVRARLLRELPADPYEGKPLRFRKVKGGVVVYSLGPDGQDNQGQLDRKNTHASGTDLGFQLWDLENRRQPPPPPEAKKKLPEVPPGPGVPDPPGKRED